MESTPRSGPSRAATTAAPAVPDATHAALAVHAAHAQSAEAAEAAAAQPPRLDLSAMEPPRRLAEARLEEVTIDGICGVY
jgi:mycofactocin precursor